MLNIIFIVSKDHPKDGVTVNSHSPNNLLNKKIKRKILENWLSYYFIFHDRNTTIQFEAIGNQLFSE